MASIYTKNNKIYISWYDITQQKRLNRSLNMENTPKNMKEASVIKKKFEEQLNKEKEKIRGLAIKRKDIKEAFEHFLRNNATKHPKTIKDYMRFYMKFTEQFNENKPCSIINKINVEQWLNSIKKLDLKKNTIFGYFKQLNHFLNFLFEYDYIPMFKINRDVKPKVEIVEKIIISPEDMAVIFEALKYVKKTDNFKNLLYLLYYTGLRASDLLSLEIQNVDINNRSFKFYSPKRKVYRAVAFHEDLVSIFQNIIKTKDTGKVLEYKKVESLQRAINEYLKDILLSNDKYSSRSFRKTFITVCRKNGMDESVVKELVGHSHTSTTDRFYNKIDDDQMKSELEKYRRIESLPFSVIHDRIESIKKNLSKSPGKLLKYN